ncbi:hypothetical protein JCM10449v2_007769 [Rhodotorula kratochvilovae]
MSTFTTSRRTRASRACIPSPDRRRVRCDTIAYVKSLENRIEELETRLAQAEGRSAPAHAPSSSSSHDADDTLQRRLTELEIDEKPVLRHGHLLTDADGEFRWHTETHLYQHETVEQLAGDAPANIAFLPVPLSNELHAELIHLAFTWHLDIVRFVEKEEMEFNGMRTHAYSPFVHLAVLAVGCRYMHNPPPEICSDPLDPNTRGFPFHNAALDLITSEIASPNFSTIRGLMILANTLGGIGQPRSGWLYSGVAQGLCIDFGLHIDPPPDYPMSAECRVTRRKLFWASFVHHLDYSICWGRPSGISLADVHQSLLPLPPPTALPGDGASWPYETRLRRIELKVSWLNYTEKGMRLEEKVKHEKVRQLWGELQEWYHALPPMYRGETAVVNSPDTLHLTSTYITLVILLLKPYYASPCSSADIAALAAEQCAAACTTMAAFVKRYEEEGPTMRFCTKMSHLGVMYAAVMSLHMAHHALSPSSAPALDLSPAHTTASAHLSRSDTLLSALLSHAQTWPSTAVCVTALRRLRASLLASRAAGAVGALLAAPAPPPEGLPLPLAAESAPAADIWAQLASAGVLSPSTSSAAPTETELPPQPQPQPQPPLEDLSAQPLWAAVAAMSEGEIDGFLSGYWGGSGAGLGTGMDFATTAGMLPVG